MDDHTGLVVSEMLIRHGLEGPAFDVADLADALAGWREAGRELDRLLEDRTVEYATTFDAEWS